MRVIITLLFVCLSLVPLGCGNSDSTTGNSSNQGSEAGQLPVSTVVPEGNFVTFESGSVRPLAMSADGNRLFATNTPNGTLEILTVSNDGLQPEYSVPVGLEPVAG